MDLDQNDMRDRSSNRNLFPSLLSLLHGGTTIFLFCMWSDDGSGHKKNPIPFTHDNFSNIPNWFEKFHEHSNKIYTKYPPLEFPVGHVLVGVNPCGRCAFVSPLLQIAKLSKKSQNNGFKICEMTWVGIALLLKEGSILSYEMIWVEVGSKNLPQFNL